MDDLFGLTDPKVEAQFAINAFMFHGGKRNARIAWLSCVEADVEVPDKLIEAMKADVRKLIKNESRTPESLQGEQLEKDVLRMLYYAKTDYSVFLSLIQPDPESKGIVESVYPTHVLEPILHRLLTKKYSKPGLYELLGELLSITGREMERKTKYFNKKLKNREIVL